MATIESPVFILGLHRSGTTLLYHMLAESQYWHSIWAWHVICFDAIQQPDVDLEASLSGLRHRFHELGLETRDVDSVRISPETREEYGFILDNHGYGLQITRRNSAFFSDLCRAVQNTYNEDRPLLLKNPWDFGNALRIKRLIPSARFIYIHRNPVQVLSSMWRFLARAVARPWPYVELLSCRYARLMRSRFRLSCLRCSVRRFPRAVASQMIRWTARQCHAYLSSIRSLPAEDFVEITFESLCREPAPTLQKISDRLKVPLRVDQLATMVGPHASRIEAPVAEQTALISRLAAAYMQRFGYQCE